MSSLTIEDEIAALEEQIQDLLTGDPCSIRTANEDITNAKAEIERLKKLLFLDEVPLTGTNVYIKIDNADVPALATRDAQVINSMKAAGQRVIEDAANNLVYTSSGSEIVIKEGTPNPELDSLVSFIIAFNLHVEDSNGEQAIVDTMSSKRDQQTAVIDSRQNDTAILAP